MRARIAWLTVIALALSFFLPGCQRTSKPPSSSKSSTSKNTPAELPTATTSKAKKVPSTTFPLNIIQVGADDPPKEPASKRKANRLAKESSPYLLLHAHNPVDWYPWGPEAFDAAKRANKPIFLSVGYSSCYWCHVMERLVFSNDEIAKLLNDNFINIKVDREERPDIDEVYMTSLQVYLALTQGGGSGGWPLSMFLTPTGEPLAGGSYFPPQDMGKQIGFPKVAQLVLDAWTNKRKDVEDNAKTLADLVRREMRGGLSLEQAPLTRETVQVVAGSIAQSHDAEFGGIDFSLDAPNGPKFPAAPRLLLLQDEFREHKDIEAGRVLHHTLDAMALSGLRDHLAGGFHRYSTDRQWRVPHFEKMLYDNAQLLDLYVEAYRLTKRPLYREVADDIIGWLMTEMQDLQGGFFSAIDAETNAIEGQYYVWTATEVERLLGADTTFFRRAYGMVDAPPFEHGYVLFTPKPIDALAIDEKVPPRELAIKLYNMRRKLLATRQQREKPLVDDKILTAWNGLAIRALANAGSVFSRKDCLDASQRCAMFVLTQMIDKDRRLLRSHRGDQTKQLAFLDDYAYLIEGLLTLHWVTRDAKWLNAARHLTDAQNQQFWDAQGKAFFFTSTEHEKLFVRFKDGYDGPTPSANSVSVRNLVRLASLTGDEKYQQMARETLESFAGPIKRSPRGFANMALALSELVDQRDYRPLMDQLKPFDRSKEFPKNEPSKPTDRPTKDSPSKNSSPAGTTSEPKSPDKSRSDTDANTGLPQPLPPAEEPPRINPKKDRVVAQAFLSTTKLKRGKATQLAVVLTIDEGWHINANPSSEKFLVPTTISMKATRGSRIERWGYPSGSDLKNESSASTIKVYDGEVVILGSVIVPDDVSSNVEELELTVRYQACNSRSCEAPRTMKFAAKLPIAAADEEVERINDDLFLSK